MKRFIFYKKAMGENMLNKEKIIEYLGETEFDVHVEKKVTSTNTLLKELAKSGGKSGYVLIAEEQTEGRGRLGRIFFSPSKTGVYMSILLRPKMPIENALFITTSTAVAVSRAIEKISEGEVIPQIKWVNDVFVNGRKVCGILTESSVDSNGMLEYAVLGIGINLLPPENDFPSELQQIAGSVFGENNDENLKNKLVAEILKELAKLPANFMSDATLEEYRNRSMVVGKQVTAIFGEQKESCFVLGIDEKARLVVKFENGKEKAISTGVVSIKI